MAVIQNAENQAPTSLGAFLKGRGTLPPDAVERAERLSAETGDPFGIVLTRLGLLSESDLVSALSDFADVPVAGQGDFPASAILDDSLSRRFLREARVLPLAETGGGIVLAMADPLDPSATSSNRVKTGRAA